MAAVNRPLPSMTDEEHSVFDTISAEPKHIDAIMAENGSAPGRLGGILTTLELKGLVLFGKPISFIICH